MMTPSPLSGDLATPLPTRATADLSSDREPTQQSFGVRSIHSSVALSDMISESPEETPTSRLGDDAGKDEEESRRLEDALRVAMTMSGEIEQDQEQAVSTHHDQEPSSLSHLSPYPITPSQPNTSFDPSSRSVSPSTSSISLSLSTPASPVSLSSIPASMSLSMDLDMDTDSSTSWSLHESSAESRSGSPLSVRNQRTGVGTAAAQDGRSASGIMESASMATSRPALPYAISRRNTATIPRIIRTSSATRGAQQGDSMQSSGNHSGSFQSDATARDIHSRSHWAVQESVERQRYQGDLFELVLPVLDLPGASVTSTGRTNQDSAILNAERGGGSGSSNPASTGPIADTTRTSTQDDTTSSGVLNIVLCGTNRTTNIFLREIMQDPRFDIYKLPAPGSTGAQERGAQRGRTARTSNRSNVSVAGKEAFYTVGVYTVERGQESRRLVARIKVFGKGQQGNLERVSLFVTEHISKRPATDVFQTSGTSGAFPYQTDIHSPRFAPAPADNRRGGRRPHGLERYVWPCRVMGLGSIGVERWSDAERARGGMV